MTTFFFWTGAARVIFSEKRYSIVKEQGAYAHKTTAKRFSSTFTYKAILPDPDISGLNKQTGKFAYFHYST